MTEQDREQLVEAMLSAKVEVDGYDEPFTVGELIEWGVDRETSANEERQEVTRRVLQAALAAIDAAVDEHGNRIAWVAPWEATGAMDEAGTMTWDPAPGADLWNAMRDACLAGCKAQP